MKVNRICSLLVGLILFGTFANAKSVEKIRAESLGRGMNLSYLDHYWSGTKEKAFSDFVKESELTSRRDSFRRIKEAGFDSVRIPINFGAWATLEKPYRWRDKNYLSYPDRFIKWALEAELKVIVDLHHVELDRSFPKAATTARLSWLWKQIAVRYKKYSADQLLFELRNEPHGISADAWRNQAKELIKVVRKEAPNHTLVVGFHDWNSRTALVSSKPFKASNIIYTFHYYDPFIFTHQGATWSGKGLESLKGVPFPFEKGIKIKKPAAMETWIGRRIDSYGKDSNQSKMLRDLKEAKEWAAKHDVPIYIGEFGSFSKYASEESRCRHALVVYRAMKRFDIPNAWWEWDGGFSMFSKGTKKISKCMNEAIKSFD